jgi:hypothetical protein
LASITGAVGADYLSNEVAKRTFEYKLLVSEFLSSQHSDKNSSWQYNDFLAIIHVDFLQQVTLTTGYARLPLPFSV